jgi:predicted nucleic acid-binding protein
MERNLVIYLDTCIYGRPFDWPQPPELRAEVAAMDAILKKRARGELRIIGSASVISEIGQITDPAERASIEAFYHKNIDGTVTISTHGIKRAQGFEAHGIGNMDALHLATAEDNGADFLLTVDKDFVKKSNILNLTIVKVMNPTDFVKGGNLK